MERKITKNDTGANPITIIIILAIVGLLIWQFILPYGFDVKTPYDYVSDFLTENIADEDITTQIEIYDKVSNVYYRPYYDTTLALQSGHIYQMILTTNAPYQIGNKYIFNYEIQWFNNSIPAYETITGQSYQIGFDSLWTNDFVFELSQVYFGNDYRIYVEFLSPNGVYIGFTENLHTPVYLTYILMDGTP